MKTKRSHTIKFLAALIVLLFFYDGAWAQTDNVYTGAPVPQDSASRRRERNDAWKENLTYGGDLQLQFGSFTFIYLAPTIGYKPIEELNVGIGVIYNYIAFDYGNYGKFSQSVYGGHSYARYFVTDGVFLQGQYDKLRQPDVYNLNDPNKKTWVDYLMVGGGFQSSVGNHAGISTSIMYNLTPSPLSIYPSRIILQFGFISTF
jgi:hypothetical protein